MIRAQFDLCEVLLFQYACEDLLLVGEPHAIPHTRTRHGWSGLPERENVSRARGESRRGWPVTATLDATRKVAEDMQFAEQYQNKMDRLSEKSYSARSVTLRRNLRQKAF